ncbi:glucuronoxylan 4-O-methyltransferase 3-like [Nicotiana tabacum]|uniref:Glucuronoxylan 4-O-methyltransferase 3-like n=1 Tax=Nicotiana tabacum TaxID=4097 RepID=A0A1S4B6U2_TOBAC
MKEHQATSKNKHTMIINKLILSCMFFIFLLYLILRTNSPSFKLNNLPINSSTSSTYNKIPPSLAEALFHYAATNITPQQKHDEISMTFRVLEKKSPCNFLIFGLGFDSLMWSSFNYNGRTIFIEEDKDWIEKITKEVPTKIEAYHYTYETKLDQATELLNIGRREDSCKVVVDPRNSKCPLALKNLPKQVYEIEWDVIMVDAPTGSSFDQPGRMKVIYTAGLLARNKESGETDVFVHDCKRYAEDKFSRSFLCEEYIREEVRYLRHFTIPSYRSGLIKSFCP